MILRILSIIILSTISLFGQSEVGVKHCTSDANYEGFVWVEYSELDQSFCCYDNPFGLNKSLVCPEYYTCPTFTSHIVCDSEGKEYLLCKTSEGVEYRDITTNELIEQGNGTTWTLFSKYSPPHPDAATYDGSFTHYSELGTGSNDPDQGFDLNNWNSYVVCSDTQPADDSTEHFWRQGTPDSFTWANYDNEVAAYPICEGVDLSLSNCKCEIVSICKCDDISGDSTEVVSYHEFYQVFAGGSKLIGTFTDETMSETYTPISPVDCCLGAVEADIVWERVVLENGTFTSDPLTTALSYSIETIGDGVTIDDGTNSFPVYEGERGHWGNDDYNIFSNTITITATNSVVVIIYKKLN